MYFQYPLQTLARRRNSPSQVEFARQAKTVLRDSDDVLAEPLDNGLAIFAANEDALLEPTRVLRELYGDLVHLRRPRVRYIPGEPMQEPVMNARIHVRREYSGAVLHALRRREARLLEECLRSRLFIVRAEAPLTNLLGLPAELEELTDASAVHWIRLTHYAPVEQGPGPEAA